MLVWINDSNGINLLEFSLQPHMLSVDYLTGTFIIIIIIVYLSSINQLFIPDFEFKESPPFLCTSNV